MELEENVDEYAQSKELNELTILRDNGELALPKITNNKADYIGTEIL